jgi:Holliday junction resolvase RusA-like endonuclease
MKELRFTVYGKPLAQKRHRHFSRGKFVRVYDPSKADKTDLQQVLLQFKSENNITKPIEGSLAMKVVFNFERPKSHYRTGKYAGLVKESAPIEHTNKPDLDNLAKFVLDSMNKMIFNDDSQISNLLLIKNWCEPNEQECTIITLR